MPSDINECVDINTQCPETKTCSNIPASYECICNPTQVESDGKCISMFQLITVKSHFYKY